MFQAQRGWETALPPRSGHLARLVRRGGAPRDDLAAARGILLGALVGTAAWAALLVPLHRLLG